MTFSAKPNTTLIMTSAFILIAVLSCNSQKSATSKETLTEKEQIESVIGTKYDCTNNDTDQYKLCFAFEYDQKVKYTSFVIYDTASDEIIHQQSKVRSVTWEAANVVRVNNFTRMPTGDETGDYYLFDVDKKEKLNNNNN